MSSAIPEVALFRLLHGSLFGSALFWSTLFWSALFWSALLLDRALLLACRGRLSSRRRAVRRNITATHPAVVLASAMLFAASPFLREA